MNTRSQAPTPDGPAEPRHEGEAAPRPPRLELPDAAHELLAIVGFVTSDDGPLKAALHGDPLSPWHKQVLEKALERLEVIDHYLRGRVAFFMAGKDHGYGPFGGELELAGAALDTCRAAARMVDALLAGRQLADAELEAMGVTTGRLHPALAALENSESSRSTGENTGENG